MKWITKNAKQKRTSAGRVKELLERQASRLKGDLQCHINVERVEKGYKI